MSENTVELRADAQGEKLDAILKAVAGLIARVDDMEKNLPAPPLVTAADKKKAKKDDDRMDDDEDDRADDDEEEEESKKDSMSSKKAKAFMMRKAKKDDDDEEEDDKRKDAEGSNPEVHGPAGEIKPDDEDDRMDDDEEEAAKKDEEEAAMCDAQAKADSVFASFGKSASRPLNGESLINYRKRMLRGLQGYSDAYKHVNINSIKDEALLALAEKQIFADAVAASRASAHVGAGQLVEINEKDRAGRTITKFRGDMEAWLGDFKVPALRVMKFNTMNNQR
jgi:hypothetical protein